MHIHQLDTWRHSHDFVDQQANQSNERRTTYVVILTVLTMVAEITAGWMYNSMALLADGWHMATHAGALGIAVFAYRFARQHRNNRRFTFGVGKIEILGGYSSAIILGLVALMMVWESLQRLLHPLAISYDQAMAVAVLGLVVNLISAWLLHGGSGAGHHHHHHGHHHGHQEHHHAKPVHKDQNLRAAYVHVLADALTSVLAIAALLCGKAFGWIWMDAAMGILGALIISRWAIGLLRDSGGILLDHAEDGYVTGKIQTLIEGDADNRVVDLHVWHLGAGQSGAIISLVTHYPRAPEHYKSLLSHMDQLAHVTVEIHICKDEPCLPV